MPTSPSQPAAPPPALWVCTCGYDLTGLPTDAATKCPECGAVIAETKPKMPWFHHWGWLVGLGLTPAMILASFFLIDTLWPRALIGDAIPSILLLLVGISVLVSVGAFWLIFARAFRARTFLAHLFAVLLAMVLSFVVNWIVVLLVLIPVSSTWPD
jgi:hypothetical protein